MAEVGGYSMNSAAIPRDKYRAAYFIFFLQGVGMLFIWNVLITAVDYFKQRFCGTSFEENYLNFFGIFFNLCNVIGLALSVKYQSGFAVRTRVIGPLLVNMIIFILTTIVVLIPPSTLGGNVVFAITLASCVFAGLSTAVLQGGIFGLSGMMPFIFTSGVLSGQGLAGVTVSIASIVSIAAFPPKPSVPCERADYDDVKWSAFAYFFSACLVLAACIISFFVLERLPIVKYYRDVQADLNSKGLSAIGDSDDLSQSLLPQDPESGKKKSVSHAELSIVFSRIKWLAFSVLLIFWVTLGVFPSVTSAIKSVNASNSNSTTMAPTASPTFSPSVAPTFAPTAATFAPSSAVFSESVMRLADTIGFSTAQETDQASSGSDSRIFNDLFVPLGFLAFNLFDLVGRLLAGCCQVVKNPATAGKKATYTLFGITVLRIAFCVLFLLCNAVPSRGEKTLPLVFNNDAFPLIFMILFATTNGYFASLIMMYGPSQVSPELSETAGTMMVFFLTCGLAVGSFSSFGFSELV